MSASTPRRGFLLIAPAVILLCAASLSPAAGASAAGSGGRPDEAARLKLASVNGDTLTLADLRESFETRHSGHGGLFVGEEILRAVLDKAIAERLLIQEGRAMGIPEEPEFKQAVEIYRDLLRLENLEQRFIHAPAEPTLEEVKGAYALLSRQVHVAIIETRGRGMAEEALVRLRAGEEFEALARKMSTHSSRTRGGDLGWVTWGSLDPATEQAALGTAPGQVAGPFAAGEGFRLVKVIGEKKGEPPPYEKVAERLRAILRSRREKTLREDLLATIRKSHPPREDAAAVARLLAAPAEAEAAADSPNAAVLMTTASGLPVTAGRVRERARRTGLRPAEAWRLAAADALLVDEARRRITSDAAMEHKVWLFADGRVREKVEREVIFARLEISDADVKVFYEKDPDAFAAAAAFHLRHIVLAAREQAEEVRGALAAGADFTALARQKSRDAASAAGGGDLGWVDSPPAGADGAAAETIFALEPGQISGVIETKAGFSIVQLLEKKAGETPAFEKVRDEAARRLVIAKQKELRDAFLGRLKKRAGIRIFEAALRRAVELQDEAAAAHLSPAAAPASPGGR